MISDIGCEDMCGALWQWCSDTGGVYSSGASWVNAYDANDSGVGGQHYQAPYRGILGGNWSDSSLCGSRCSHWNSSPLTLYSFVSARAESDGTSSKF
jgi:formylglycine-generating enzyme required for sulfatase activity